MRASPPTLKTHVVFVGNAPNAENARCFCRGRCPHRPVASGTDVSVFLDRSGDAPHGAMRASPPTLKTNVDFVGIAPNAENARYFFVGADAYIGPDANGMGVSVFPDRYGIAPHGAMRASPPTLKTHIVFVGNAPNAENARFFVGADALIGPWLAVQACSSFLTAPETHPTRRCRHRSYEKSASGFVSVNREIFGFRRFTCILHDR